MLSEKVAETSVELARKLAERPVGLHRITMVLASVVAFGAVCMNAGYDLAGTGRPFWVGTLGRLSGAQAILSEPARDPWRLGYVSPASVERVIGVV